jgi:hypothetical protein
MKKKFCRIVAVLGFLSVFFSAAASDGGASLKDTVPPAVIGCLMLWAGIVQSRKIEQRERYAVHRRTIHAVQMAKKESDRRESVL